MAIIFAVIDEAQIMTQILVTPDSLQEALDKASAGDRIQLQAGRYDGVYTISRRRGTEHNKIVIEPAQDTDPTDCQISQRMTAEEFRPKSNRLAQSSLDLGYSFPGLYPWIDDARLRVFRCEHVTVRGLCFRQSWPTHIFIDASRDVVVQDCRFEDATFCIGAFGPTTRDILVERCTWTQDIVPNRIWHQIPWHRIHGATVDTAGDYRLFDGDFFRSNEISGGVTIRHCKIKAAFNAIHGYNTSLQAPLNRDFNIYQNSFEQIRDNVFEPEDGASNWWFHHNDLVDVHKWFSIECVTRGPMFIFSNIGSFRTWQGSDPLPGDTDENTGGAVFKALKKATDAKGPFDRLNVFHNSFLTRSAYIKKGLLPGMNHLNNAVSYSPSSGEPPRTKGFFGSVEKAEYRKRFTSSWQKWNIRFDGDVIGFPAFAQELNQPMYPLGADIVECDPMFIGQGRNAADFELAANSPARTASIPMHLQLPSSQWSSNGGDNVGALQGPPGSPTSNRFPGPSFAPTLAKLDYETFMGS
ncbi:hypothetical protein [Ruegeria sp. EL01]|uniref:hypothetical protein n=1 Tax=Ruegeria sp. EL01 TaxID=2107578 RepID=UPI0013C40CA8|nr:hypothetical protein [Ruegeria sp. EL01]